MVLTSYVKEVNNIKGISCHTSVITVLYTGPKGKKEKIPEDRIS